MRQRSCQTDLRVARVPRGTRAMPVNEKPRVSRGVGFCGYLRFGWNLRLDRRLNHPIFSWAIPASMPFFSPKLCEKTRFDGGILDKDGIKGYNSDAFRRFSVKISHQIALYGDFLWGIVPMPKRRSPQRLCRGRGTGR